MSQIVKVNYYDAFRCIGGDCPFTCCQEWAITVDEDTLNKWKDITLDTIGVKDERKKTGTLCDCIEKEEADYVMALKKDKTCPFLNKDRLCSVVVSLGEDYLSKTCTTYPRHTYQIGDKKEYSLDFGCPAVIDLIAKEDKGISFIREGTKAHTPSALEAVREMLLERVQDDSYSLTEGILMAYCCLLELLEEEELTVETVEAYKSRTYLEALVSEMRTMKVETIDSFWERNEQFLDRIQLYRKDETYTKAIEDYSTLAEKLEEYYSDAWLLEKNEAFEKQYQSFEGLLRNYLAAELWANCLREKMTLVDVVMVYGWVILEYCAIKQLTFLKWLSKEGEAVVDYSIVRDSIMIIARMIAYDKDEIEKCLAYSFEEPILDWGTLALIVGSGKM